MSKGRLREDFALLPTLRKRLLDNAAQSSVEYAIVVAALLCVVLGLLAVMQALRSGLLVEHAVASASHALFTVFGGVADVFSY